MTLTIFGGRLVLPSGELAAGAIDIDGERIAAVGPPGRVTGGIDATGLIVAPGIVDLHGDAFERQIMPRPGVTFPIDGALIDTDRQMTANGITTAFHGLTYSWEPGLRGRDMAVRLLDALERLRPRLGCDTKLHLRWETFNLSAVEEVVGWIAEGRVHFLAFNDHFDEIVKKCASAEALGRYADRSQISSDAFVTLLGEVELGRDAVPGAIRRLTETALRHGIRMASHDDYTAETRASYQALGCRVAEFPRTRAALMAAQSCGSPIVMGAPNIVRGGSHLGSIDAAEAIAEGLCDVLVSDYYYPAQLQSVFDLARRGSLPLAAAWPLIAANPAKAAGFDDRGELVAGQRADLVLIDDSDPALPRVVATLVAGQVVHLGGDAWRLGTDARQRAQ
ncbi:MAG TPA: alpha-D-ribose 1-methylphosphonate 5-triphosphate diphosphatase [Stellaceae bacterium]|nr:alpha-D-ribose 1-methylphosphonate 5-triphosphate diphosphatase [Stellaceae bacterium]